MSSPNNADFRRLLEAMSQGSEDAAWELAEVYTPHIMRAIRASLPKVIRTKVDSQDFAQAVWASILLKRDRLSQFQKPEQFIGYLATIAKNKVIDMHRHFLTQKNDVHNEVIISTLQQGTKGKDVSADNKNDFLAKGSDPTPSQVAVVRETWKQLMSQSSSRDQQIISLRIEGLAYPAIAERLAVSEKTVQRALNRLLENFSHE